VTFDQTGSSKDVRLLVKGYGPRIRFEVDGVGRKFDVLALSTTVGAGVAFLGIASLIVNAVMMYGSGKKSKQYENWLFAEFNDDSYGATEDKS
jgi:P2X purinoceptor 4